MGNDVDGANVAKRNGDALFAFAEGLDDFFDAAANVFDGRGLFHELVSSWWISWTPKGG
jgi:hypothetical protein